MKDLSETPPQSAQHPPQTGGPNGAAAGDLEERFRQLAAQWKQESLFLSSTTAMADLPSYQKIIALGPPVVPLLLRELERDPDHWFWALKVLTGANPVPADQRGDVRERASAYAALFGNPTEDNVINVIRRATNSGAPLLELLGSEWEPDPGT